MVLGFGTSSTDAFVVFTIGELLASVQLKDIVGVPTSKRTQEQVPSLGIPLSILEDHPKLDLTTDGANEVDQNHHGLFLDMTTAVIIAEKDGVSVKNEDGYDSRR
ncbi:hypothetical protein L6452_02419 [Arctium lappa]|uniref:Uncharacterized protein n=1 Tax=Arctium lappa TaxID=4217 RepID=A0ACB9FJI1_ARCLA|nr:hypothetical protein L6452_02419 [Arctium lappa]